MDPTFLQHLQSPARFAMGRSSHKPVHFREHPGDTHHSAAEAFSICLRQPVGTDDCQRLSARFRDWADLKKLSEDMIFSSMFLFFSWAGLPRAHNVEKTHITLKVWLYLTPSTVPGMGDKLQVESLYWICWGESIWYPWTQPIDIRYIQVSWSLELYTHGKM